jgi:hypothetical protein
MTNFDQLLIRACKSNNPYIRLESLIRRFYMTGSKTNTQFITLLLAEVSDKHYRLPLSKLTKEMYGTYNSSKYDGLHNILVHHFRYAEVSKLSLPRTPAMFRYNGNIME